MTRIPVVLDVDTGLDDSLALLLAARSPALDLLGVTCVTGNVTVDKVVGNTLKVLAVAGRGDVPVAIGRDKPLLEKVVSAAYVHGEDGLGGLNASLPAPEREPESTHAVDFLANLLAAAPEPVTLVPLGPLTNIAVLLRERPEAAAGIHRIVLMGGAVGAGNASAVGEFNIRQDPEAAEIVLTSGLDVTLYTWDVFTQVTFSASEVQGMTASASPSARLAGQLMDFMLRNFDRTATSIGDAGAVASVIEPEGLETRQWPMRVELTGTWTRGMTVADQRPTDWVHKESAWQPPMGNLVSVSTAVDVERFRTLFRQAVEGIADPG